MVRLSNGIIALAIILAVLMLLSFAMNEGQSPSSVNNSLIETKRMDSVNHTSIFDGTTLDGWRMAGSGNFVVTGNNTLETGGQGILWYAKKKYENFVLQLDWKVFGKNDNLAFLYAFPISITIQKLQLKKDTRYR